MVNQGYRKKLATIFFHAANTYIGSDLYDISSHSNFRPSVTQKERLRFETTKPQHC
jgi:hypothetical protein